MKPLYCIKCHARTNRNYADESIFDGIYCAKCAPRIAPEPRPPFITKRLAVNPKSIPKDWPSVKKLLDTAPMLGVERAVTELRFCFEEKGQQAFFEQCGAMHVDPDALIKTAKKNTELMTELSKQQDRVTRALREIKEHLIALRDGWRAVIENGGTHTSVQLYNHINSELQCLEELAAKYEVDLDEEDANDAN